MANLPPSSSLSSNGSETFPFSIDKTPLTLEITPLLGQKIARNDLVITLYDSREYVRRHLHFYPDGRLTGRDEPFSSTKLPSPPLSNCVVRVESGKKLKSMTYKYLGDTVQGLMDYAYFPYTSTVNSFSFRVVHDIWGELGMGSLEAFQPQADRRVSTQKL